MTEAKTLIDEVLDGYSSPGLDLEGQARTISLLRAWHHAIENKNLSGIEALMHEDIVIELPFSESGRTDAGFYRVYEGIPACLEFWKTAMTFEKEFHPFSDMDLTLSPDGSRAFLEARGHLTMTSGAEYRNRYVMRLDVKDGKVRHCREYYNPIVAAIAFGRPIAGKFTIDKL